MKRILFIIFFLWNTVYAQEQLTLDQCYQYTEENFPLSKLKSLNSSEIELKIKNLKTNYLPKMELYAQAGYQSDVVALPVDIPFLDIPELPHDSYKVALNISQTIYDGGITRNIKAIERNNVKIQNQTLSVQIYQTRERVNDVYFMLLLMQKQKKQLKVVLNELNTQLKVVEAGVKSGVLTPVNKDILMVEVLKIEQNSEEIAAGQKAAAEILSELTGKQINKETVLLPPDFEKNIAEKKKRPEYVLFDAQRLQNKNMSGLINAKRMPKIGAFGEFGYGRPGLNILDSEFDTYYLLGAKFSWNIWDWNSSKRERQILSVNMQKIDVQQQNFDMMQNISLKEQNANIEKLKALIEKDKEIIGLRTKIRTTYASQLKHGVITSTTYITELNAETQAKLSLEMHTVQLMHEQAKYNTTLGN